jgi:hypothetical protein
MVFFILSFHFVNKNLVLFYFRIILLTRCAHTHLLYIRSHFDLSDSMNDICFMHIQGGKLYGTSITGQVLWEVLMFTNGLNSFEVSPKPYIPVIRCKFWM